MNKKLLALAALSAAMLASCEIKVEDPVITVNDSEDITVETGNAAVLNIEHNVGDVDLSYGETDKAEIHVDYSYKGFSQKVVDEIGEHLACKAAAEDDKLVISIVDPVSAKSFTSWKNSNAKASEVTVDLKVVLPKKFDTFDVDADVGNITIDALKGSFDIKSDVGNIEMKSVELLGDSAISSDVGDITIELAKVAECDVKVNSDVGNISLDTGGLQYESSSDDEKPVGAKKEIVVEGKCNIKLECDVGELTIGQGDKDV